MINSIGIEKRCSSFNSMNLIPLFKKHRKYFRVALLGKVHQFTALRMELSISARIFNKTVLETLKIIRTNRIHIHGYFDDWLIKGYNPEVLTAQTQWVIKLCQELGWLVNIDKSELIPKQKLDFIGVHYSLKEELAQITEKRLVKIEELILSILSQKGTTARGLARLIGK